MISIVRYLFEEESEIGHSRDQARELLRRNGRIGGPIAMGEGPSKISDSIPYAKGSGGRIPLEGKDNGPISLGNMGPSKIAGPTSLGDIKPEKVEGPQAVGFDAWQKIIKKSAQTAVENK